MARTAPGRFENLATMKPDYIELLFIAAVLVPFLISMSADKTKQQ